MDTLLLYNAFWPCLLRKCRSFTFSNGIAAKETAQRSLSPVCLGWRIALPSGPRITLATMGSHTRSPSFVPMSCVRLRPRDVIHFYLDSKWPGGGCGGWCSPTQLLFGKLMAMLIAEKEYSQPAYWASGYPTASPLRSCAQEVMTTY